MSIKTVTQEHRPAGVTAAAPWRVRAVNVLPGYRLSITCNDDTSGIVDMSALIFSADAGIFTALKDVQLFQQVRIELGALTWPNGADLDPVWVHEEISKNKTWSVPNAVHLTKFPLYFFGTQIIPEANHGGESGRAERTGAGVRLFERGASISFSTAFAG